jgi:hypothetical protein
MTIDAQFFGWLAVGALAMIAVIVIFRFLRECWRMFESSGAATQVSRWMYPEVWHALDEMRRARSNLEQAYNALSMIDERLSTFIDEADKPTSGKGGTIGGDGCDGGKEESRGEEIAHAPHVRRT